MGGDILVIKEQTIIKKGYLWLLERNSVKIQTWLMGWTAEWTSPKLMSGKFDKIILEIQQKRERFREMKRLKKSKFKNGALTQKS